MCPWLPYSISHKTLPYHGADEDNDRITFSWQYVGQHVHGFHAYDVYISSLRLISMT